MKKYDIAVIGSGPGGFAAAVRAAQLGAKVALVEKSFVGGTCLNCGCVPTKFLWQALNTKRKIRNSFEYGFGFPEGTFSFAGLIAKKDKNIANMRKGMEMILSSYCVDTVSGGAFFKDAHTLEVNGENGRKKEISAEKIIIAAGSRPSAVKGLDFDGKKVIGSTEALDLTQAPSSLLIIGGGAIGVEMASIFAGFGSRVTIAEYCESLLPGEDSEISGEIQKNMLRQGIEVLTGCTNAPDMAGGFEKVILAAGRIPSSGLNIECVSLETDQKGFIKTDRYCATNIGNIYAVGDIAGKNMLAYTAQAEGAAAAENAVKGNKVKADNEIVPAAVFSNPPAASVKIKDFDEENAVFGKFPFTASARAFLEGERSGFVKCAVDKITKKPLGFWIVGPHADELINTASVILKSGTGCMRRESVFHPSLSESLLNAYEDAFGMCTEIMKRKPL